VVLIKENPIFLIQGTSIVEVKENILDALELYLEAMRLEV
jgi:predicted RNase H-like HicB family nuclease